MNTFFRENKPLAPSLKYKSSLDFPSHLHEDIELIYIIKGSGFAYCEAQKYELKEGSFFIAFPNQIHSYENFNKNVHLFSAIVKPSLLLQYNNIFLDCIPESNIYNYSQSDPENILALISYLMKELDTCSQDILQNYLTMIFGKILKHYSLRTRTIANDSVSEVVNYCTLHYAKPISISTVAKALNISESYISYIFNKRLFIHFSEYINALRISKALNLLEYSNQSVSAIAGEVGFNTIRTFNRAFQKRTGKSPSQMRKEFISKNKKNGYIEPTLTFENEFSSNL